MSSSSSTKTVIREAFGKDMTLYEVLGLTKESPEECTASKLRRAYYRAALQHHPDKNTSEESTRKFQAISVAYQILSNPRTKQLYDDTGDAEEEEDEEEDDDPEATNFQRWTKFFSTLFGKVTSKDIDDYEAKYKYSDDEEADVLNYYQRFQGNARKMLECVICSSEHDVPRWMEDYIQPAIERGDVPDYGMSTDLGNDKKKPKKNQPKKKKKKHQRKKQDQLQKEDEDDSGDDEDDDDDEEDTEEDKSTETDDEEEEDEPVPKSRAKRKRALTAAPLRGKKEKQKDDDDMSALVAKIRGGTNNKKRPPLEDLLSGLEQRYAKKSKKGSSPPPNDIADEEFERIRANLDQGRKSKQKTPPKRRQRQRN